MRAIGPVLRPARPGPAVSRRPRRRSRLRHRGADARAARADRASTTLGLDSSRAMLERGAAHAGDGLTFELGDIAEWAPSEPVDLLFTNAALHWVDDHPALFGRLTSGLLAGGQLAVQCRPTTTMRRTWWRSGWPSEAPFREAPEATCAVLPCLRRSTTPSCCTGSATSRSTSGCRSTCTSCRNRSRRRLGQGNAADRLRRRLSESVYDEFVARYRALLLSELSDERPVPVHVQAHPARGRLGEAPDGP